MGIIEEEEKMKQVMHFKTQKERFDFLKGKMDEIVPKEAKKAKPKVEKAEEEEPEKTEKPKKKTTKKKSAKKEVKKDEV